MSDRANIPVKKKTQQILKKKKLKAQAKARKELTWDQFLLEWCGKC